MNEINLSDVLDLALTGLGVGFCFANGWIGVQFVQFLRRRTTALVTWPGRKPPYYGVFLVFGVVFGILLFIKLVMQRQAVES